MLEKTIWKSQRNYIYLWQRQRTTYSLCDPSCYDLTCCLYIVHTFTFDMLPLHCVRHTYCYFLYFINPYGRGESFNCVVHQQHFKLFTQQGTCWVSPTPLLEKGFPKIPKIHAHIQSNIFINFVYKPSFMLFSWGSFTTILECLNKCELHCIRRQ